MGDRLPRCANTHGHAAEDLATKRRGVKKIKVYRARTRWAQATRVIRDSRGKSKSHRACRKKGANELKHRGICQMSVQNGEKSRPHGGCQGRTWLASGLTSRPSKKRKVPKGHTESPVCTVASSFGIQS